MNSVERRHVAQSVAADVSEDPGFVAIFLNRKIEGGVEIPVPAALAERRRTRNRCLAL